MYILGLDFETTGLDPVNNRIIEIGAVVWDTDKKKPVDIFSRLLLDAGIVVPSEITVLTGITQCELMAFGSSPKRAFIDLGCVMNQCGYVVAHNDNAFDKPFLEAEMKRHGLEFNQPPWLDARTDIEYPPEIQTTKLKYLACEHGFVNPFSHRAVFDVLTMLTVLSCYDIHEVVALSKQPIVKLQAICRPPWEDGGASTGLAKAAGFHWDGGSKRWLLDSKGKRLELLLQRTDLQVIRLE
jgi:DNA polymerase-3 subunit epsilon